MSKYEPDRLYAVEDLKELLDRLMPGMVIKARILEDLDQKKYIMRIRGYNMVIESETRLSPGDEVDLKVLTLTPRPRFSLNRSPRQVVDSSKGIADIIVH